jgi:hypothetical protein
MVDPEGNGCDGSLDHYPREKIVELRGIVGHESKCWVFSPV